MSFFFDIIIIMSLTQGHEEIDQDHPGSQDEVYGNKHMTFKIGRINIRRPYCQSTNGKEYAPSIHIH
jgi:hypothetical protein